jgi:hypothetical protein
MDLGLFFNIFFILLKLHGLIGSGKVNNLSLSFFCFFLEHFALPWLPFTMEKKIKPSSID